MICSKKNFGPRKSLGLNKIFDPKEIFSKKKTFGKHCLYVTIRFVVCFVILDFCEFLLVTWIIQTLDPLNSAKIP